MPSAPQIIAGIILGLTFGHLAWAAAKTVQYEIRIHGFRAAGKPTAKASGQLLMHLFTTILWIALLAWGGFWS